MTAGTIDLQARKRQLLIQSEFYRQTLAKDLAQLNVATLWMTTMLRYARLVSPVLAIAVPVAGFFFRPRKKRAAQPPPRKKNLLGRLITGYKIARQVKPIWDGFHRARAPY